MKNKIYIIILLCLGFLFGQSALGRIDGQLKMQNRMIDALDDSTRAMTVIDYFHHQIHDGNHFNIGGSFSLNSADTSLIVFDVADTTKYIHLLWNFSSTVGATVVISSGGVIPVSAHGFTINNNNMNSTTESVLDTVYAIHDGETAVTRYGATLRTHTLGALKKSGGELGREGEWILKNDSLFVIKVTSNAGSEVFDFMFEWYEETFDGE